MSQSGPVIGWAGHVIGRTAGYVLIPLIANVTYYLSCYTVHKRGGRYYDFLHSAKRLHEGWPRARLSRGAAGPEGQPGPRAAVLCGVKLTSRRIYLIQIIL